MKNRKRNTRPYDSGYSIILETSDKIVAGDGQLFHKWISLLRWQLIVSIFWLNWSIGSSAAIEPIKTSHEQSQTQNHSSDD